MRNTIANFTHRQWSNSLFLISLVFINLVISTSFIIERIMTSNAGSLGTKDTREGSYSYLLPIIYNQTITLPIESLFGIESTLPITMDESGFSEMLSAGSVWFRRHGVLWSEIEREQGTYDWDVLQSFEQEILLASERSINLIPVIRGTPL